MSKPAEVINVQTMPEKPTKQRVFLVAILCIGLFVCYLDRVNISVLAANDAFLTDMGIKGQPVKIGMLMSVFLAVYGISNVTLTAIGNYLGPRKTLSLCVVLWILSLFIGGIATTFMTMLIARVILGVGEGIYYPLQSVFVKNWIPLQERGRANASWVTGQMLALAFAMPFFAYIIATWGWRESFWVALVISLLPLYLFWFHTTDTPHTHKKVNALELKHIEEGLAKERQGETASQDTFMQRFKTFAANYRYWLLVCWYMMMNVISWGMISWLPTYLKVARGFTWMEMSWFSALPYFFAVITITFSGWIADRTGKNAPLLAGGIFLSAICMYLGASVSGKYTAAFLLAGAFGGSSMGISAAWTLLQGLVSSKTLGTAGGVMNGMATGVSALSPVFLGFFIGLGDYAAGLYALAAVGLIGAAAASVLAYQKY